MMAESGFDLRKWKANSRELQIFFDNKEAPVECNNKIMDDLSYLDTQFVPSRVSTRECQMQSGMLRQGC